MQYLKQNERGEEYGYEVEDYVKKSKELEKDSLKCMKVAFDMTVRKVIDSGLIYKKCSHKSVTKNHGKGVFGRYGNLESFNYQCNQCKEGVNKHDCHIEGETYYMTCNEAQIVNTAARNYGINGSIATATRFRD